MTPLALKGPWKGRIRFFFFKSVTAGVHADHGSMDGPTFLSQWAAQAGLGGLFIKRGMSMG